MKRALAISIALHAFALGCITVQPAAPAKCECSCPMQPSLAPFNGGGTVTVPSLPIGPSYFLPLADGGVIEEPGFSGSITTETLIRDMYFNSGRSVGLSEAAGSH